MKRKLTALLLTLLMVLALPACSSAQPEPAAPEAPPASAADPAGETPAPAETPASGEKIKIAAIYRDMTQSWFIQEAAAATATAEELGMEPLIVGDSKEDPSVYVNVLDNVLSQDIQGLIVNICDQQLSKMTVDKCAEAGIPVVAVDVPLIDDAGNYLAPAIELDSYLSGKTMGEWLADYIGKTLGTPLAVQCAVHA